MWDGNGDDVSSFYINVSLCSSVREETRALRGAAHAGTGRDDSEFKDRRARPSWRPCAHPWKASSARAKRQECVKALRGAARAGTDRASWLSEGPGVSVLATLEKGGLFNHSIMYDGIDPLTWRASCFCPSHGPSIPSRMWGAGMNLMCVYRALVYWFKGSVRMESQPQSSQAIRIRYNS